MAFDGAGQPHIVYAALLPQKTVTHAKRDPGSWLVTGGFDASTLPSAPAITHLGRAQADILLTRTVFGTTTKLYAWLEQGGIWNPFPPLYGLGRGVTGIASDVSGDPVYVAASRDTPPGFYAMRKVNDTTVSLAPIALQIEPRVSPIPTTADVTLRADGDAVIDSAGQLHVTQYYEVGLTGYLLYAVGPVDGPFTVDVNADMGWTIKTGRPSIAVDAQNRPHIAYTALWPVYGVRYAVLMSVGWSSETIEAGGNERALVGTCPDVLIDSGGTVHVIYADGKRGLLRHASRPGPGAWQIETIDTIGVQQAGADPLNGLPGALGARMDAAGGMGVAYWDADDGVLKYAYLPGP